MARWDNHTEQDKLDTITRKRANQKKKRRAASAARPAKPKKVKLSIALPVEHVTGNIVERTPNLRAEAFLKLLTKYYRAKRETGEIGNFGKFTGELFTGTGFALRGRINVSRIEKGYPELGTRRDHGETLKFEPNETFSKEAEADRQMKLARADAEEAEEEYRISLIRMPDWQALFGGAHEEYAHALTKRIVELVQKDAEKDHKRRRKAFDAATQKPVRKVKASDDPMEHTKEMIAFLTWLLSQPQKAISKQSIEEEIARLEGLVNSKTKRT